MEETENQMRKSEVLITPEDYRALRKIYVDMSSGCTKHIKDAIRYIEAGAEEKAMYLIDISRPYRKKQGFFSRMRDKRIEKRQAKLEAAENEDNFNNSIQSEDKPSLLSRIKALTHSSKYKALESTIEEQRKAITEQTSRILQLEQLLAKPQQETDGTVSSQAKPPEVVDEQYNEVEGEVIDTGPSSSEEDDHDEVLNF